MGLVKGIVKTASVATIMVGTAMTGVGIPILVLKGAKLKKHFSDGLIEIKEGIDDIVYDSKRKNTQKKD